MYNLSGYRKTFIKRKSLGGGMVAYVHNTLEFNLNINYTCILDSHESLFFTVKCPNKIDINFWCIYSPPSKRLAAFTDYLQSVPSRLFRSNTVILGGFNVCPVRDGTSPGYVAFEDFYCRKIFDS